MALHRNSLQQGEQVLNTVSQTRQSLSNLTVHSMLISHPPISIVEFDFQEDMQDSIRAIQNETEAYFKRMNTVMQWTNEKLDALAGVQEVLKKSFSDAHSLLAFTLKIIVAYLITAIPGVSIQRRK